MRGILKALGGTERTVWIAHGFAGLPKPNARGDAAGTRDRRHAVEVPAVPPDPGGENFDRNGLLDSQVRFAQGWFRDTLPTRPVGKHAVLRRDGDKHESALDGHVNPDPKVRPRGYAIADDYHAVKACRMAAHDHRQKRRPDETVAIKEVDGIGVDRIRRV